MNGHSNTGLAVATACLTGYEWCFDRVISYSVLAISAAYGRTSVSSKKKTLEHAEVMGREKSGDVK